MIEAIAERRRRADGEVPRRASRARRRRAQRRAAQARTHRAARSCRCSAARRSRTRACSRCSTRSSTTCRRRSTSRRCKGINPDNEQASSAQGRRRRAVRRARVQDHERPVRRPADVLPRLLGHARRAARRCCNATQGQARAHRPPPAHARQQARGASRTCDAGNIAAAVGLRDTHHRRHAVRREARRSCSSRWSSPSRSSRIAIEPKTKADQEKLGVALAEARRRGPDVPRPHRRGDRPDDHRRHGRAPPRDHRRPPAREFKVEANVGKPAGRVPRDHHQHGRAARTSTSSQTGGHGQYGHVSMRDRARASAARASSSRTTIVGGVDPEGVHPGRSRRASSEAMRPRRARRLPDDRRQGRARSTAATTTSTRSRWPSRSPARWRSRTARQQGRPDPARADHGGRGRHPRGVHGRRHRRPERAPRQDRWHGAARRRTGRSPPRCRSRRCSATRPTCARRRRAARRTRCSSPTTRRSRRQSPRRSSRSVDGRLTRSRLRRTRRWPRRNSSATSRT